MHPLRVRGAGIDGACKICPVSYHWVCVVLALICSSLLTQSRPQIESQIKELIMYEKKVDSVKWAINKLTLETKVELDDLPLRALV